MNQESGNHLHLSWKFRAGFVLVVMTMLAVATFSTGCICFPNNRTLNPSGGDGYEIPPSVETDDVPQVSDTQPRDYAGLHNVVAFADAFYSGSVPEGEDGFATLHDLGIKTIISVDGASPEVEVAEQHGMRYVHLPIGYDGFDEQRRLQLARATRDAMAQGPVYIHCHHGKHRSAGAAASIAATLGWATNDSMVARMHVSGTSESYSGLFDVAQDSAPVSMAALDEIPGDFPSVSKPEGIVKSMVEIDHVFSHLKRIEAADWQVPADHPDLVPAAEAGRLADLFRLLVEDDAAAVHDEEYDELMAASQFVAQQLEDGIVAGNGDIRKLSGLLNEIERDCRSCHERYRN